MGVLTQSNALLRIIKCLWPLQGGKPIGVSKIAANSVNNSSISGAHCEEKEMVAGNDTT